MKRHTPETIAATLICLICGSALLYLSHRIGVGKDMMRAFAAMLGPVGVVLGIGMAIHGGAMPPTRITPVTRVWGTVGSIAACAHVWFRGYFEQGGAGGVVRLLMPVALIAAWWLPSRFYED